MTNPLVSVVIPTYRRSTKMLQRAIESVQNQSYSNIEIIVVDDNASEKCKDFRQNNILYLDDACRLDKRIKYVLNGENLGGALSRNNGILKSSGTFITFLDDDDYFLSNKIEHQVSFMLQHDYNCSFTDLVMYNLDNVIIDKRSHSDIDSFSKEYLLKYHIVRNITGTETFMFTKQLLVDIGMFDDVLTGHEFFLMLKAIKSPKSNIGYFESNDIVAYRTKEPSISNGPNKINGENAIYSKRREYFYLLTLKEKRIVRCRHYSVLGIAYIRRKQTLKGLFTLMFASLISPGFAFQELFLKKR